MWLIMRSTITVGLSHGLARNGPAGVPGFGQLHENTRNHTIET